jgi:hypothetical protein
LGYEQGNERHLTVIMRVGPLLNRLASREELPISMSCCLQLVRKTFQGWQNLRFLVRAVCRCFEPVNVPSLPFLLTVPFLEPATRLHNLINMLPAIFLRRL